MLQPYLTSSSAALGSDASATAQPEDPQNQPSSASEAATDTKEGSAPSTGDQPAADEDDAVEPVDLAEQGVTGKHVTVHIRAWHSSSSKLCLLLATDLMTPTNVLSNCKHTRSL